MKDKRLLSVYIFAVFFLVSVTGCGRPKDKEAVLARIGDMKITVSDFDERISNLPLRYRTVIKKRKKEFLQEIINDILLYQEAIRQGLQRDRDVVKVIEEARKKILIARLLKDKIDDRIVISADEIEEEYNRNKSEYMMPEVMRVSHILLPSREEALEIMDELEKGESFEEMARAKSIDPTAQNGGDIGYFPRGQLIPEFEDACAKLQVNEIAGPVKSKLGYHIIKLTDRKEPVLRPLDTVRDGIKSALYTRKRRQMFNRLIDRLTEETKIEIDEEALEEKEAGAV